ncbi:MAG: tetratricopeptide repeat protein [Alphaproteobacteria bacterium]|nr:tetratricopeptide repeat protein [Alphaproteobacteria bacterium]
MTLRDCRDNAVSTPTRQALAHYDRAVDLLHSYFLDPVAEINKALALDPDFVMGHCFKGTLMAVATEKSVEPGLRQAVEAAESLSAKANDRELAHVAALRAWLNGRFDRAVDLWGRILLQCPRDSLALQAAHLGDFYLGQSSLLRDRVARVLPFWDEQVPGFGYVLGMHAFGLEETQLYVRAEETGRRALALNPRDPWAVHAVAHVMEMQGRTADGIAWLTSRAADWSVENMFAFHNWWHLALYHLDRGDIDRVLALYDSKVRPSPSAVALEMLDASSLLWRLHLRQVDVGQRWRELADKWAGMAEDGYYAFNDLHAMMSFVATGRGEDQRRLIRTLETRAAMADCNAMMCREVGLPLARAIAAFGRSDYRLAADLLLEIKHRAHLFGGSHAQRDVLSLTLIEAALRAGEGTLGRAMAAERTDLKPASPFNWQLARRAARLCGDSAGERQAGERLAALGRAA